MSGGHFEYRDTHLGDIAQTIEDDMKHNDIIPDQDTWNEPCGYGFCEETLEFLKALPDLLRYLHKVLHEYDYMVCSDSSEESFLKEIKKMGMPPLEQLENFFKERGIT